MEFLIWFFLGLLIGAAVTLAVSAMHGRANAGRMRETFAAAAAEALDANSRRLSEQTEAVLEGKKAVIDKALAAVGERLESVRQVLQGVEVQRKGDYGSLSTAVASLATVTGKLQETLGSTQRRGAWGERMAEDILRLAGLQEKVNYVKQSAEQAAGGRPDFTFFLPNSLTCNMDVKFPLEHYKAYIDSPDAGRPEKLAQLASAVRGYIRQVAQRGYVDPKAPTVPYVIVFIPSEQILSLALSAQPDLIDEALGRQVVLAGPMTLYAMLAVMRQAAENANILTAAAEVMELLGVFSKQWEKYCEELDKLGQRIELTQKQFDEVRTTRSNVLQRPLDKIEQIRQSRELPGQ